MQDDRVDATRLLRGYGRTTTAPMTLWPPNMIQLSSDRRAFVAFRHIDSVAVVLGDPIGEPAALPAMIDEFLARCTANGWTPSFYYLTPLAHELVVARGLAAVCVGEEATMQLPGLAFSGQRWGAVRTASNRARREGVRFAWFDQATGDRAIRDQVWDVSAAWLAEQGLPEMDFPLGTLRDPPDPDVRTAIVSDADGRVEAFATFLPIPAARGWTLDMIRYRPKAMPGVTEFLIAATAVALRDEGAETLSLGIAPLARITRPGEIDPPVQRALHLVSEMLDPLYHFESLFAFKEKFSPVWSPVYLVYPDLAALPKVIVAIFHATLPGMGTAQFAARVGGELVAQPRQLLERLRRAVANRH